MAHELKEMTTVETKMVSGGVTMTPDGKGCTEPKSPKKPDFGMEQGGPLALDMGLAN